MRDRKENNQGDTAPSTLGALMTFQMPTLIIEEHHLPHTRPANAQLVCTVSSVFLILRIFLYSIFHDISAPRVGSPG